MVDYEKMWFSMKKHILTKNSHGKNELLSKMMAEEIKESESESESGGKDGNGK